MDQSSSAKFQHKTSWFQEFHANQNAEVLILGQRQKRAVLLELTLWGGYCQISECLGYCCNLLSLMEGTRRGIDD